jgi:hypothetical protein
MTFLKKLNIKSEHLLIAVGAIVLIYFLMNYSNNKNIIKDNMESGNHNSNAEMQHNQVMPNEHTGKHDQYTPVTEASTMSRGLSPTCHGAPVADPSELLPKDQNNEWARLNPTGESDLKNINLLKAGYHTGIDTVGSTLRNPNLQLRSEPPNPVDKVSPWMNSTIEPDLMRTPLELGCGSQ